MGRTAAGAIILLAALAAQVFAGQVASSKYGGLTPVGQWFFDESAGTVALDRSGRNPGTLTAATRVIGKSGNAYRFNVTTAIMTFTGTGMPTGSQAYTFRTWRKRAPGTTGNGKIAYWGASAASQQVAIGQDDTDGRLRAKHNSNDILFENVVMSSKSWDFIYLTFSGGSPGVECAGIVRGDTNEVARQCKSVTGLNIGTVYYAIGGVPAALNPDDYCNCDLDMPGLFAGFDNFMAIWRGYWDVVKRGPR